MTEDQRRSSITTFYELEETREQLSSLRAEARRLANLYGKVAKLLAAMERPLGMPETVPGQARIAIENDLNNIEAALDLNAILQLDNDLFATIDRLHQTHLQR
jgi:hypothetical protein